MMDKYTSLYPQYDPVTHDLVEALRKQPPIITGCFPLGYKKDPFRL